MATNRHFIILDALNVTLKLNIKGAEVMSKISTAVMAFGIAFLGSVLLARRTIGANRRVEMTTDNERLDPVSEANLHWSIVHIRDDIGPMHNLLIIANGLLAAILAAIIF
jgi:hypothetical protein